MKKETSKQIYTKKTKQVRIDADVHRMLKIKAAKSGETIRGLLEGVAAEVLAVETR